MPTLRSPTLPDNAVYYHLAYAAATAIYAGYAVALVARWKRVRARRRAEQRNAS